MIAAVAGTQAGTQARTRSSRAVNSEGEPLWLAADRELRRLGKGRAEHDWQEGRALIAAQDAGTHRQLGFATFVEYVENVLGYDPRTTTEKLRVARALESLPELSTALQSGNVNWSTVRELTRVATRETEQQWMAATRGKSARVAQELVSGRKLGDTPRSERDPELVKHILKFEVRSETMALFREAMTKIRAQCGDANLDDDTALFLLVRQALDQPTNAGQPDCNASRAGDGTANYQIAITICEDCQRAFQDGAGARIAIAPEIVDMALCDAEHIGHVGPAPIDITSCGSEATTNTLERIRDNGGSKTNGATANCNSDARQAAFTIEARATPPCADATACRTAAAQQTGKPVRRIPVGLPTWAIPELPRRLRQRILRRDRHRCVVPGCTCTRHIDVHHIIPRSEGGTHDPDALITLCAAHHRQLHFGRISIQGRVSSGLTFRHADGSAYGNPSAEAADCQARVFQALRGLGFGETDVRRTLDRLRSETSLHADPERLLRCAIDHLTRPIHTRASPLR